jgi:hypothetical protein
MRVRVLMLLAGALLGAGLTGCGGSGDDLTISDPGASSAPSPNRATSLKIRLDDGAGKTTTWTLTCDDAGKPGGTHPHPERACAALAKGAKRALPPVGKGMMCTELYGGPQTARITGVYLGQSVSSSLSRTNGCEISRWDALDGLLPADGNGVQ